jgi:TonB family protein
MIKWFKGLVIVFMAVFVSSVLSAGEIAVELRFYQGFYENGNSTLTIVSSYSLKKISDDKIIPFMELEKETRQLKEIYKLKKVKRLDSLNIILGKGKTEDKSREFMTNIRLNGRTLILRVYTVTGQKDRFGIEILEKGEKERVLLESEVIVPDGKTAVLGFKDSEEKIYFLAFNRKYREKEETLAEMLDAKSIKAPKLLKKKEPEYPKPALKGRIEGEVVLKGHTNLEGNVTKINILQGHPLLAKAAEDALNHWKYAVWEIDGVKKPVSFSMIIIFRIKRDLAGGEKEIDKILERYRPLLKEKEAKAKKVLPQILEMVLVTAKKEQPKKEISKKEQTLAEQLDAKSVESPKLIRRVEPLYPSVALKANIEGDVILRGITDTDGNVEEVKVLSGHPLLREPAVNAARQWKYLPWKVDGTAYPVEFTLVLIYRVKKIPSDKINSLVKEVLDRNTQLLEKGKKKDKRIPSLLEVILVEKK